MLRYGLLDGGRSVGTMTLHAFFLTATADWALQTWPPVCAGDVSGCIHFLRGTCACLLQHYRLLLRPCTGTRPPCRSCAHLRRALPLPALFGFLQGHGDQLAVSLLLYVVIYLLVPGVFLPRGKRFTRALKTA
jgi:hypothetical protein